MWSVFVLLKIRTVVMIFMFSEGGFWSLAVRSEGCNVKLLRALEFLLGRNVTAYLGVDRNQCRM